MRQVELARRYCILLLPVCRHLDKSRMQQPCSKFNLRRKTGIMKIIDNSNETFQPMLCVSNTATELTHSFYIRKPVQIKVHTTLALAL